MPAARNLGKALKIRRLTLAVAESCTGGLLSEMLTDEAGASVYFLGGVVAYSDEVKVKVLGVKAGTLRSYGAVSEATALEMAAGARRSLGADIGIAITGIAGPGGGSDEKPVGLVHFAFDDGRQRVAERRRFEGDRDQVRHAAAEHAAEMALRLLTP
jgi:nicotinamide-nucleotide amidase